MELQSKKITKPNGLAETPIATALLPADRKLVGELFAAYDKAHSPSRKKKFVAQIRTELTVPAQVDEEIFYPALSAGAGAR